MLVERLGGEEGVVVAASDYMKALPDGIGKWVPGGIESLGTDGYGRSDNRKMLRHFFEVNRYFVTVAALKVLADAGDLESSIVVEAMKKYGIDPQKPNPVTV